ncbi:putative amidohydrolase YtcJ [Paramyrothecium foliicola]|nr:putative amidohydrolase YtcJ [Paramyrothecium foliicola]
MGDIGTGHFSLCIASKLFQTIFADLNKNSALPPPLPFNAADGRTQNLIYGTAAISQTNEVNADVEVECDAKKGLPASRFVSPPPAPLSTPDTFPRDVLIARIVRVPVTPDPIMTPPSLSSVVKPVLFLGQELAKMKFKFSDSMLVRHGKIAAIGSHDDVVTSELPDVEVHDLNQRVVLPGFIDGHMHLLLLGQSLRKVDLFKCQNLGQIKSTIKSFALANPDLPTILSAIEVLQIADMPDPAGGKIYRKPDGTPTGLVDEGAMMSIIWPFQARSAPKAERIEAIRAATSEYNAAGYTGVVEMAMDEEAWDALVTLKAAEPDFPLRVAAYWLIKPTTDFEANSKQVQRAIELSKLYNAANNPDLKIVGIKLICDGIIDACTAFLSEPYGPALGHPAPIWEAQYLDAVVKEADAGGIQVALHAIGDATVKMAIDAIEKFGTPGRRHRIEHLELVSPRDAQRLGELGLTASIQPVHADPSILQDWPKLIGEDRCKRAFAYRDFADAGALMAIGSDSPTSPWLPMHNLYIATTRKSSRKPGYENGKTVNEHMRLGLCESIVAATGGAARSVFSEDRTGSLAVGKLADFIVVDMEFEPETLLQAKVEETWFEGRKPRMKYARMPIEVESPEEYGYEKIKYNLSESSVTDQTLVSLGVTIPNLTLLYNEHRGSTRLRELIVADSPNLNSGDVLITGGAAGALFIIATSQLTSSDHLVVVRPNYATNLETPKAIGCEITHVDLKFESGFQPDLEDLRGAIKENTKLVSITTPHNPSGTVISEDVLGQIVALTKSRGCLLLVDETYRDVNYGPPVPVAASLGSHVISVSSLSKSFGIPGIRIGWIIAQNSELLDTFLAAKEQISISGSVIDEYIAEEVLSRRHDILAVTEKEQRERLEIVEDWIDKEELLEWVKPSGGVVCFPRMKQTPPGGTDAFYSRLLDKYHTYLGPGHWFEMSDTYFRLGYGWPTREELQGGLEAISKALRG